MSQKSSFTRRDLAKLNGNTLDEQIAIIGKRRLGDVVMVADGCHPMIGLSCGNNANAGIFLVCRLFTDAIFNQDIRAIQLIINRTDGGLPKDYEVADFQTEFGDCLNQLMDLDDPSRLKVFPEDTVMMALCKSLYDMAVQDIYWDPENGKKRKPSTDKKQERDAALRMILERVGGRKTTALIEKSIENVETADWIKNLPA